MCILFFALSPPAIGNTKYRFILGSNRDEAYERPTQTLSYWNENPQVLCSQDLKPGRGNGTWLGINSKTGQFATLTNYRVPRSHKQDINLQSRGRLVSDYLQSSESPMEYTAKFMENSKSYGGCSLITGNLGTSADKPQLIYSTNAEDHDIAVLYDGVHGLSNKTLNYPWKKLETGKESFSKVISEWSDPEQLIKEIVHVMSDGTTYKIDPSIADMDWKDDWKIPLSSVFVKNSHHRYGTRTISAILVEEDGRGWYYEQSLQEPIDSDNLIWSKEMVNFKI